MRSKAILMALLVLAFGGVEAASVDRNQAEAVARAWAARGRVLGARFGKRVEKSAEHATDDGAKFYSVKMRGGGTVFVSSDDESEPVVAFTSSTNDFSSMDRKSPLWALLSRDANVRQRMRRAGQFGSHRQLSNRRWSKLLNAVRRRPLVRSAATSATATSVSPTPETTAPDRYTDEEFEVDPTVIDDMRVMPLLETRWSQTTHNDDVNEAVGEYYDKRHLVMTNATGKNCYNYYTPGYQATYLIEPNIFDGETKTIEEHMPCGCTATATAQIMRFHKFPTDKVEAQTLTCTVNEESKALTMMGGYYNWDLMTAVPSTDESLAEENCKAIGHLTYDVGVALRSSYSPGNTGAEPRKVAEAVRKCFGYANAVTYWNQQVFDEGAGSPQGMVTSDIGLHNREIREKVIYTNLDARKPLLFAIYGYSTAGSWGGHAVVGDGYGFANLKDDEGVITNTTAYVHVNLGWSGQDDAWYNLPEIHAVETGSTGAEQGFNFTILAGAIYNVFTEEQGEIISGRVFDQDGNPMPGAVIRIPSLGLRAVADDKGIYSVIVPSLATYSLETDAQRGNLEAGVDQKVKISGGRDGNTTTAIGNVWGVDLTLGPSPYAGSVEIVRGGSALPNRYGTLDYALADAQDGDEIKILRQTVMKDATCIVSNRVKLVWGGDDSYTNGIFVCNAGAKIRIVEGGRLEIGDRIYLPTGELEKIEVAEGGVLALSGNVSLPEVFTEGERCIEITGEILSDVVLNTLSLERYARFGTALCDPSVVSNCSQFVVDPGDMYMCVACSNAEDGVALIWDLEVTPDSNRDATLDVGKGPVNYRNLDRLLQDVEPGSTVTVYRACSISKPMDVQEALTLQAAEGGTVEVTAKETAGFLVGDGAFLEINGIVFYGFFGDTLITVGGYDDAIGGSLQLGGGTIFDTVVGYNENMSGTINVVKGTVVLDGVSFSGCQAQGAEAHGGAISLSGAGCTLEVRNADIWNCAAKVSGGGIFAGRGSEIVFSGWASITENWSPNSATDNVYVSGPVESQVLIAAPLSSYGPHNIGIKYSSNGKNGVGNAKGNTLAAFEDEAELTAAEKAAAARLFFSDNVKTPNYRAEVSVDGKKLVWYDNEGVSDKAESEWWTRVIYPETNETNCYDSIDKAFACLRPEVDAIIEPLRVDTVPELIGYTMFGYPLYGWKNYNAITRPVRIEQNVTIRSPWDKPPKSIGVYRFYGDTVNIDVREGGSLTVTNICMNGYFYYHYQVDGGLFPVDVYEWVGGPLPFVEVSGGEVTLKDGAEFDGGEANPKGSRSSAAVAVWKRGTVTMEKGSLIHGFRNGYVDTVEGVGVGSGLTVDNGIAYLKGGEIRDCVAYKHAGVFVGNEGEVHVSGDVVIEGNKTLDGADSNLAVQDLANLYLDDEFTGSIGCTNGFMVTTEVFGRVSPGAPDATNLVASAARFYRDPSPEVKGTIVTNATEALLVWSTALRTDAEGHRYYEDESGNVYGEVEGQDAPPEIVNPDPIAFTSIERVEGKWVLVATNAKQWCWYSLWSGTTPNTNEFVMVEGTSNQWRFADGPITITNEVPVTDSAARFWILRGAPGEKGEQ